MKLPGTVQGRIRLQMWLCLAALLLLAVPYGRELNLPLFPVVLSQMSVRHWLLGKGARVSLRKEQEATEQEAPELLSREKLSRLGLAHALLCMLVVGVLGASVTAASWALALAGSVLFVWLERHWAGRTP